MQNFDEFFKTSLNPQQQKAVKHAKGSVLVIAGAGSGKTRVITSRIAYLIVKKKVKPSSIIALTFTNKAANEMKERIETFLGNEPVLPFVGTFHSYCLSLLRSYPMLAPIANFTIFDSDDKIALIKKIIKRHNLEKQIRPAEISGIISLVKNKTIHSHEDELATWEPLVRDLYVAYEREKTAAHGLDFDDLLLSALRMFKNRKDFRASFQQSVRHILVDEYQDTNVVQQELLKYMARDEDKNVVIDSLCAVGDEDQSIYSWRGATPSGMLNFKKEFAPVRSFKIEQNYRSVQPILQAANTVIQHNTMRNPKKLWSDRPAQGRILSLISRSEYQEVEAIATMLKQLPEGKKLSSVGILYRTHFQSRIIEEILINRSIPYRIIGSIHFYARKEIKDLLAYLRLIINPYDRVSLFRVINAPNRGLGTKFEELLETQWAQNPLFDFTQLLSHVLKESSLGVTGKKAIAVKEFLSVFSRMTKALSPTKALNHLIEKTNYFTYLRGSLDSDEAQTKIENVREFVESAHYFEQRDDSAPKTIETFLHEIALLQEKIERYEHAAERVTMMTVHAAKGLEFETVIVAGLEDGLFPSNQSLASTESLEEERRLFYVAITRARERVVVSRALFRSTFGQIIDQSPSRFLSEIPPQLKKEINLSHHTAYRSQQFFADWLNNPTPQNAQPKENVFRAIPFTPQPSFTPSKSLVSKPLRREENKDNVPWKKNRTVLHKKFGPGVICDVEQKGPNECYLTVLFKVGKKKISSRFVSPL